MERERARMSSEQPSPLCPISGYFWAVLPQGPPELGAGAAPLSLPRECHQDTQEGQRDQPGRAELLRERGLRDFPFHRAVGCGTAFFSLLRGQTKQINKQINQCLPPSLPEDGMFSCSPALTPGPALGSCSAPWMLLRQGFNYPEWLLTAFQAPRHIPGGEKDPCDPGSCRMGSGQLPELPAGMDLGEIGGWESTVPPPGLGDIYRKSFLIA